MLKQKARNWYWWLWLSPLLTIPTLVVIFLAQPGKELICGGTWVRCDRTMEEQVSSLIAILCSAIWHLILLIPARNKESEFIRWHGRQALLLAGVRTVVPLVLVFAVEDSLERWLLAIPALIVIWFGGTLWGQRQAIYGNCSLMRWSGQEEQLSILREADPETQHRKQDAEALVEIIRFSQESEERRSALGELQRRGMVESL